MTVRELLDVLAAPMEIFIKPAGRRMYFDGPAEEVPEGLLDAFVQEVSPRVVHDDDPFAIKRYYGFLGIWVEPIAEWDERADREKKTAKRKERADRILNSIDLLDSVPPIRDEVFVVDGEENDHDASGS